MLGEESILIYIAEDSYVIDLEDIIDKSELTTMLRNSFNKFKERFDLQKLGTVLQNHSISPIDERKINFDVLLSILV